MMNNSEKLDHEPRLQASKRVSVPGIELTVKDIRAAYPEISEESIARILGLPLSDLASLNLKMKEPET